MSDRLAGMTDVDLVAAVQGWAESCRDEERESDADDRFWHRFRAELLEALLARVAENQALRAEVRWLEAEVERFVDRQDEGKDRIDAMLAENNALRAERDAEKARLRGAILRAAERYEKDGQPGDLGSVWGWRTIAEQLRGVAELDGQRGGTS